MKGRKKQKTKTIDISIRLIDCQTKTTTTTKKFIRNSVSQLTIINVIVVGLFRYIVVVVV